MWNHRDSICLKKLSVLPATCGFHDTHYTKCPNLSGEKQNLLWCNHAYQRNDPELKRRPTFLFGSRPSKIGCYLTQQHQHRCAFPSSNPFTHQPLSRAVRMDISMSCCPSEPILNTVICTNNKETAQWATQTTPDTQSLRGKAQGREPVPL